MWRGQWTITPLLESGDPPHNPEHKDTKQIIFQSEHSPIFVINILNPILFINITFTFTTNILCIIKYTS